jgi:hypothetical protein
MEGRKGWRDGGKERGLDIYDIISRKQLQAQAWLGSQKVE